MGTYVIQCMIGFSTSHRSPLTDRLEGYSSTMDSSYRDSQNHWLTALSTLHDAVDAALADDGDSAAQSLSNGRRQLAACNDSLTALALALVELRSDLFERGAVDPAEPLIAREPYFSTLDYDGLYRELAGQGAVLPHRAFWDETAARVRDGGARGGCRLLERHLRELQSDLHAFIGEVEAAGHLPLRAMGEALHDVAVAVSRVMTSYTRLITAFGYVSFFCERALRAYGQASAQPQPMRALAVG